MSTFSKQPQLLQALPHDHRPADVYVEAPRHPPLRYLDLSVHAVEELHRDAPLLVPEEDYHLAVGGKGEGLEGDGGRTLLDGDY